MQHIQSVNRNESNMIEYSLQIYGKHSVVSQKAHRSCIYSLCNLVFARIYLQCLS